MQINTNYVEISKLLSGTTKVSICFNSLVSYILNKHKLSANSIPLHLIHHNIENLFYNMKISGLTPFFTYSPGSYETEYNYIRNRLSLPFNDKFYNAILVYVTKENINFVNSVYKEGTFVLLMNDIYFEFPFIYCHLLTDPVNKYFEIKQTTDIVFDSEIDKNDLSELEHVYKTFKPVYFNITIGEKLQTGIKELESKHLYDPHIHFALIKSKEAGLGISQFIEEQSNFSERSTKICENFVKDLKYANIPTQSDLSELDYRIKLEEKSVKEQQIYSTHLKMLSNSLGTSNLFSQGTKEKVTLKKSSKTMKIMEENLKKIELSEKKKENEFIKMIFDKYKSSSNKPLFFETLKINESYKEAQKKILLLKVEYYYEDWITESRKERPFEGKKVNCYFNIFEYLEKFKSQYINEFNWLIDILRKLGFESTAHEIVVNEKLDPTSYNFKLPPTPNDNDISFLLKHYGPYLKRSVDSRKDSRVLFEPDFWQFELLNLIDDDQSVIVSAPTSSGKTFICFYVIHKLLAVSDDVVLFILPTKALVNQVTADIYSRFSQRNTKNFLQGQIMPDYSVNPFNSQVILTVPSMAEQILLTRRVKYVILDECHLICENESIERILHLLNCPIVMLSATIGNIEEFHASVNKILSNNKTLKSQIKVQNNKFIHCIEYKERYCDNKPYVFNNTLVPINTLFAYSYDYIRKYGFTDDLNFLPDEILNLYYSIYHVIKNKSLIHELRPQKFFKSNILNKRDVILYEKYLLSVVQQWINDKLLTEKEVNKLYFILTKESKDVFDELRSIKNDNNISNNDDIKNNSDTMIISSMNDKYFYTTIDYMLNNIHTLCNVLKDNGMLPCIIFNTDRKIITSLAVKLYNELNQLNIQDNKLKDKLLKEKKRNRDVVEKGKDLWKEKYLQEEEEHSLLKENYEHTYTDNKYKLSDYELKEMMSNIKAIDPTFKSMLSLGIGVHHDGLYKKFRSVVEILFRKRHLQVIFATETLSLGINMPCKTVVFTNDILYSLAYKQMSGRAGRRGYDLQGNVVFFGVEENKVKNMIISDRNNIITKNMINYTEVIYSSIKNELRESFTNESMFNQRLLQMSNKLINDSFINSDVFNSIDLFINHKNKIFDYKINVLQQLKYLTKEGKKTYLSDILILNKDRAIQSMIMLYLIHNNLIKLDKHSLLDTLVHFFGVKNVVSTDDDNVLNELSCTKEVNDFIYYINNKPLPFFYWYNLNVKKSNYILQFIYHNIKDDIKLLFHGLKEINDFIKSIITVYERFTVEEEVLKRLRIFIQWFEPMYTSIHA